MLNDCNSLKLSDAATKSRFLLAPQEKEAVEAYEKAKKHQGVVLRKRLTYETLVQL